MKKIALTLLAALMVVTMASCGGDDDSSVDATSVEDSQAPVTAEEFKEKLLEKKDYAGEMIDLTKIEGYVVEVFGLSDGWFTNYIYFEVDDTTNSYETIAVFAATSTENANSIKEKLDSHISNMKAQFGNYNATINDMVEKSVVKVEGDKVYMIISPKVSEIEKVVLDNIKGFN